VTETRKLVAILAADVVGYSRLTSVDEDRTLARLRALRSDLIDPTIAVHMGRVIKRTGDGALVEFRSVVDAVRCATEVQNAMVERNAGLPPDQRIEFRIGIHLGDVVEESDGDLMGEGVNIAARLEGVAQPGAICLSEDAYRQVKSRLDLKIEDLGEIRLKNIIEPVRGLFAAGRDIGPSELCGRIANLRTGETFACACSSRQALHRGFAFSEHERRSKPGESRRWGGRGHPDGLGEPALAVRHRPQFQLHL
jgi:class 3 adenylate cyclase